MTNVNENKLCTSDGFHEGPSQLVLDRVAAGRHLSPTPHVMQDDDSGVRHREEGFVGSMQAFTFNNKDMFQVKGYIFTLLCVSLLVCFYIPLLLPLQN